MQNIMHQYIINLKFHIYSVLLDMSSPNYQYLHKRKRATLLLPFLTNISNLTKSWEYSQSHIIARYFV